MTCSLWRSCCKKNRGGGAGLERRKSCRAICRLQTGFTSKVLGYKANTSWIKVPVVTNWTPRALTGQLCQGGLFLQKEATSTWTRAGRTKILPRMMSWAGRLVCVFYNTCSGLRNRQPRITRIARRIGRGSWQVTAHYKESWWKRDILTRFASENRNLLRWS